MAFLYKGSTKRRAATPPPSLSAITKHDAREKGRDLTQSYDKSSYTSRNVKGQSDNTNNATKKKSITQLLQTDLGRSVGVTTATQLVWLTGSRAQHSHFLQQPCNQKDKHLKMCKLTSLYRQQTNSHPKRRGHENRYTCSIGDKYYTSKMYIVTFE